VNRWGAWVLVALLAAPAFADSVTVSRAKVTVETRSGKAWTVLSGTVEASTDLPLARLVSVITDWPAYPRLFPKIRQVTVARQGGVDLVTEKTVVSVLGFSVTNNFTIRVAQTGAPPGPVTIAWAQAGSDGTIDGVEGEWSLLPVTDSGKSSTLVRYRTVSSVPQTLPGQDGLVGMFFPGELKQIVSAVLTEARARKERP
jgi:hypothetical protein